ncbi:MAG TPA: hypothetical protein VMY17_01615 [Thermoplasmata archaeon]|nr:hypothetical protein [Thermoplasmata archaeon]
MKWVIETEQRITRLEEKLNAMELRLVKIDYGLNRHTHDKTKDSPTFDCI